MRRAVSPARGATRAAQSINREREKDRFGRLSCGATRFSEIPSDSTNRARNESERNEAQADKNACCWVRHHDDAAASRSGHRHGVNREVRTANSRSSHHERCRRAELQRPHWMEGCVKSTGFPTSLFPQVETQSTANPPGCPR